MDERGYRMSDTKIMNEHLETLKLQQKQVEQNYMKCQGAIEFVEALIKEAKQDQKKDVVKK